MWVSNTDPLNPSATEYTWQSRALYTRNAMDALVATNGTLDELWVELTETPHDTKSDANYRFTIQHYDISAATPNWVDTALWCSIHGNGSTSCQDTTSTLDVDLGDLVVLQVVPMSGVNKTPIARWGVRFTPDTSNETWLMGSTGQTKWNTLTTEYTSLGTLDTPSSGTANESDHEIIIPDDGEITGFVVRVESEVTTGETYFWLRHNGADANPENASIHMVPIAAVSGYDRWGSTTAITPVSEGDRLAVKITPGSGSPASPFNVAAVFQPRTRGAFPMVGISTANNLVNSATTYELVNSGKIQSYATPEAAASLSPATFYVKQMFVELDAAPGAGNSYAFTLRSCSLPGGPLGNCTNTDISCTISDSAKTCKDAGSAYEPAGRDIYMQIVPASSPTVTKARMSLLGFVPPPTRHIDIREEP